MDNKEFADSLRLVADWYEAHPEIGLPSLSIDNYSMDTKEEARATMKALGSCEKSYGDWNFTLSKTLGVVTMRFVFTRNQVCERKVVGVKTIPAQFVEAKTIPARTEDIVEWECVSVLADEPKGHVAGEDTNVL